MCWLCVFEDPAGFPGIWDELTSASDFLARMAVEVEVDPAAARGSPGR